MTAVDMNKTIYISSSFLSPHLGLEVVIIILMGILMKEATCQVGQS